MRVKVLADGVQRSKAMVQRHSIRLPVLQHLRVEGYTLFPGDPPGAGIDWNFQPGVTLIAGINGLGKTTLLTMILRALTGPYDLTSSGALNIGVTVPDAPVELKGGALNFFSQRVANRAADSSVSLSALFGEDLLTVTRRLNNLSLLGAQLNGHSMDLASSKDMRETSVQAALAELIGVGTFVDVLLLLHHVILFHEDRPGALWDSNAQRHVLRALFLEKSTANRVAQLERDLNGADSQARNIHPRIVFTERQLSEVRQREAGSEGIVAELAVEQKLLDAELAEADRLDDLLSELDLGRQQARLELERAKIAREDALGAMERLKHTALLRLFPTMDDAARLVISRIMTEGRCLVCKSDAHEKQAELEGLVATGHCPACGANLEYDDNVHAQHEFEQGRLQQAREQVALAQKEEDARATQLAQLSEEYDSTLDRLVRFRQSIADRTSRERRLRSQLPQTTTSTQFESALAVLRAQHGEWEKKAAAYRRDLGALLAANEQTITAQADELARTFGELSKQLVAEDARLAPIQTEPQYTQARGHAADRLKVPAFAAEMTAADRPGYIRRVNPWDVSESQRELIDLAFRLALVRTATHDSASTFVMETPEASLDGVAMGRVALGLAQFASRDGNRLIVTSNLSNSGLITALFGGRTTDQSEVGAREQRVIDLLRVAAPNRALIESRDAYAGLLRLALSGVDNV